MSELVHLDYEVVSAVDLKSSGAHRYAIDKSTQVLMAAVSEHPLDAPTYLWINPLYATPDQLGQNAEAEDLLAGAKLLGAHNAPFEQAVTWGTHQRRAPSPFKSEPDISRWRCTAAVARKAGLPWSLDKLGAALNLSTQKDARGKTLIRFFCIPQKDGSFNHPKDHPEKWAEFCAYCVTDVATEKLAAHRLKAFELQGDSLQTFFFDLRLNLRGIPVNVPALKNAQRIIDEVESSVTREFVALTGLNPTQREKVRELVGLDNMQAETVTAALAIPIVDAKTRRTLELYQKLSYAAVKKVGTMLDWACPDSRMRGTFRYYGAGTGRWTAHGPQPHNAKKATPEMRPLTEAVYGYIERGGSLVGIEAVYGDAYGVLSSCIRHFIHEPGTEMLDGDYNAIEARLIAWLAGERKVLDLWRAVDAGDKSQHPYRVMAAKIYNIPVHLVDSDAREVGKRAILGLGYGMGAEKFRNSCREQYDIEISEEVAERAKSAFRAFHEKIVSYWYMLDGSARAAIASPGAKQGPFTVRGIAGIPYLVAQLPSGRSLAYPYPKIEVPSDDPRDQITYWGQLPMSQQWGRIKLYGAKLAENFCQGAAADIMAHGARVAEARGMRPFALVHDQALALRTAGQTAAEFETALGDLPAWAAGLPLKVEAKICKFYSK